MGKIIQGKISVAANAKGDLLANDPQLKFLIQGGGAKQINEIGGASTNGSDGKFKVDVNGINQVDLLVGKVREDGSPIQSLDLLGLELLLSSDQQLEAYIENTTSASVDFTYYIDVEY